MGRIETMFSELASKLTVMDNKLEKIMSDNDGLREENKNLRAQLVEQGKYIKGLDRELRRRNVIIKGVGDKEGERREETEEEVQKILKKMGVRVDMKTEIDEIKRLGRYREGRQRPILMKLTTGNKKVQILKQSKELKGTDVWVEEDYTKESQETRKKLISHLKEARRRGHRAQLRHDKLVIDSKIYGIEELEEGEWLGEHNHTSSNKRTVSERSPMGSTGQGNNKKLILMTKN